MSNSVTLNGVSYLIPDVGEGGWGEAVTNYLIALSTGVLQKAGGSFTLTAQVDFGASFGLKTLYYTTRSADLASQGQFRLARTDTLQWRNTLDTLNLPLAVNSSNQLTFDGNPISSLALGAANTVLKVNAGGTDTEYGLLANANIDSAAAIAITKLATINSSDVIGPRVGSSTYSTSEDHMNLFQSTGVTTWSGVSDNGDGTCNATLGTGFIRATDSSVAQILFCDWSADATLALTDQNTNYLYVDYNAGTPIIVASTTEPTEHNTKIRLGDIYRDGTQLHISAERQYIIDDHSAQMIRRQIETTPFARVSGGIISETGTLNIAITAGVWWEGVQRFTTTAFDSSAASTFAEYYDDGAGGFTKISAQTAINVTQYDDGSGSLATLGTSKYGVHWVYLGIDSDVYLIFGTGSYGLAQAEFATIPTNVPGWLTNGHARLVGKIIVQKDDTTFTELDSAFDTTLSPSTVTDHADLASLQGGTAAEYYHATSAQNTKLAAYATVLSADANGIFVGATHDASAGIDLTSTTQGIGLPNMTSTQRDAISTPKNGLLIWNTTTSAENVYDGAAWAASGSGGSGSGEINYITNGDAEVNTTGWATYDDGASAVPVDGTGGSPSTLTLTAQATTILRGTQSFKLAKSAADGQGEGLSYDFTIDAADKNKLLKIGFVYNTDLTYTNEDIKVYIYDVTNTTLITPSDNGLIGVDKDDNSSGSRTIGWSSTDSVSYRLIFHQTTTNASTADLYIDDVVVGPGSVAVGAVVSAIEYADIVAANFLTKSSGSDPIGRIQMQRVGDSIHISMSPYLNATFPSSDFTFTPPTYLGETLTFVSGEYSGFGGTTNNSGNQVSKAYYLIADGTGVLKWALEHAPTSALTAVGNFGGNLNECINPGGTIILPVAQWQGAGTVNLMSDNVAAANLKVKYNLTDTAYTSETTIDFDTEVTSNFTTVGTWANTNGSITIPEDGTYHIKCNVGTSTSWATSKELNVLIGGSAAAQLDRVPVASDNLSMGGSATLTLSKGDLLTVQATGTETLVTTAYISYLEIVRQQDYSAGQPVAFGLATADTYGLVYKAYRSKWQITSTSVSGSNDVDFDTEHSAFTNIGTWANTNGSIVVPRAGYYRVDTTLAGTTDWSGGARLDVYVDAVLAAYINASAGSMNVMSGSTTLQLASGQAISIRPNNSHTLISTNTSTHLSITEIV